MVRRLVAEVPAAPVHVAPILHQPINNVSVLLESLMMHLDGLMEGGAEVAIEGDEAACFVEALRAAGSKDFQFQSDFAGGRLSLLPANVPLSASLDL